MPPLLLVLVLQHPISVPTPAEAAALVLQEQMRDLPLCTDVGVGVCIKLPKTPWQKVAFAAIAANGVCQFLDLATTLYGIGAGVLVERNPLLKGISNNATAMGGAKAGIALVSTLIYVKLHERYPKLTTLMAGTTGGATCWAAAHNRRETER